MKPFFTTIKMNYSSNKLVEKQYLFKEIGWDDLIDDPAYNNTCAIRVSLALIKSGMNIGGRLQIKKGDYKGKFIEPGHAKLSLLLKEPRHFGNPDKGENGKIGYRTFAEAEKGIGRRKGVISFWKIPDYLDGRGGHIDITFSYLWMFRDCGSDCFWDASEIWFWELP
jgi:hypothetical protein